MRAMGDGHEAYAHAVLPLISAGGAPVSPGAPHSSRGVRVRVSGPAPGHASGGGRLSLQGDTLLVHSLRDGRRQSDATDTLVIARRANDRH